MQQFKPGFLVAMARPITQFSRQNRLVRRMLLIHAWLYRYIRTLSIIF